MFSLEPVQLAINRGWKPLPQGQFPEGQVPEGQAPQGQSAQGQLPSGPFSEGHFTQDPFPEDQYPVDRFPADSEDGPRRRAMAPQPGYSNLAQGAMALILHKPEICRAVDPGTLADIHGEDVALLRELLELVHRRPESNTGMLLGHWYGTPEGELLSRLAGQERLIPTEGIERQFLDTMEKLAHHLPHRSNWPPRSTN